MPNAQTIASAECLVSYLLRGLRHRIDYDKIGASRRRGLARELADYLVPAAVAARSTAQWARLVCDRFEVNPTGEGTVADGGFEREARAAYVVLPRRFLPAGTQEMTGHPQATPGADGTAVVRWDHIVKAIDFPSLRLAVDQNPALIATFAWNPPVEGEEESFRPYGAATPTIAWKAEIPERLQTPRAHTTVVTLTSPCAHGADHKSGNVTMFRRQRYVDPVSGEPYLAPFISGNALRGIWRDHAAALTAADVGLKLTEIDPKIAHALLAGGTIEAGADGATVDLALRRRARALLPGWDLFAGVMQQQIMRGVLRVHDATLVCRENAWLLYPLLVRSDGDAPRMAYEDFRAALQPADDLTQLRLLTRHAHRDLEGSEGVQMLTETEVLLPGAQLVHAFQLVDLDGVASLSRSFLGRVLRAFRDHAFIGAGNARGLGAVAFDPYRPGDPAEALPSEDEYLRHVATHRDEIRTFLLGTRARGQAVAEPGPVPRAKGKGKGKRATGAEAGERSA